MNQPFKQFNRRKMKVNGALTTVIPFEFDGQFGQSKTGYLDARDAEIVTPDGEDPLNWYDIQILEKARASIKKDF